MLGDIVGDECSDLLVDFVIFVMTVHSPYVIQHILVNHRSELLILQSHLSQQKFYGTYGQQDAFSPQDHDTSHTFLANVGI